MILLTLGGLEVNLKTFQLSNISKHCKPKTLENDITALNLVQQRRKATVSLQSSRVNEWIPENYCMVVMSSFYLFILFYDFFFFLISNKPILLKA
jgi:hypothetical protein